MGKGKGKLDSWVSAYKKGEIIVEFEELHNELAVNKLFKSFKHRLPFKFCFLKRKKQYVESYDL
jgi:ribosomal protein L16/L10AE